MQHQRDEATQEHSKKLKTSYIYENSEHEKRLKEKVRYGKRNEKTIGKKTRH